MSGKKLSLKIDYREKRSGMVCELEKYSSLFHIEITRLKAGDYIIEDQIIIERKTWPDFMGAIRSGTMFRQAYAMAFPRCAALMIIEGINADTNPGVFSPAVHGSLLHISLFAGVPVIFSAGKSETARLIFFAGKQLAEKKCPAVVYRIKKKRIRNLDKKQTEKIHLLQGIPGVGTKKARRVLQEFGTLKNVFNADRDSLKKVPGIGTKLANTIVAMGTGPFSCL